MDEGKSGVFEFSEVDRDSAAPNKTRKCKRCFDSQWKLRLEFAVLVTMIAIVWGLFSLPIVFYYEYSARVIFITRSECIYKPIECPTLPHPHSITHNENFNLLSRGNTSSYDTISERR